MSLFAPISAVSSVSQSSSVSPASLLGGGSDPNAITPSFGQTLEGAFDKVNDMQNHAGDLTKAFALGKTSDVHGVMIAGEQATIALQLTTQVRNKVIDAYQEVMKMSM
jgi:flagellar hook-basal body complex protein FliE